MLYPLHMVSRCQREKTENNEKSDSYRVPQTITVFAKKPGAVMTVIPHLSGTYGNHSSSVFRRFSQNLRKIGIINRRKSMGNKRSLRYSFPKKKSTPPMRNIIKDVDDKKKDLQENLANRKITMPRIARIIP